MVISADRVTWRAGLLGKLTKRTVVIEPRHRREVAGLEARRVALRDQRIRVRRIADHQHAYVAVRDGVERLALGGEDLRVREQQVLALHARAARPRAHQQRYVAVA